MATTPRYGRIDHDYGRRLATTAPDDDGPVWMVNLMSYRERAEYADGRDEQISGREADDRYAPVGPLRAIGAEPVLVADVESQLLGDQPKWDRVGVVRYPTRRSFIDMQTRPDFRELHEHKDAGMAATIVLGCVPLPRPEIPSGLRRAWSEVEHPPTAEDGPILVVHVLRYRDGSEAAVTPEQMAAYQQRAFVVAGRHGADIAAWFAVEGTIVGDGRPWDQVRFNSFPSRAAFMAVVDDPDRMAAQAAHREPAIADTYTMILRPSLDRLTPPR